MTGLNHRLPSLEETLEKLARVEARWPEEARIAETHRALLANEQLATSSQRRQAYLAHLASRDMFVPIYGVGNTPNGLPVCLPAYLMEILEASARVLYALSRRQLAAGGPQYLLDRVPPGWLSVEMAERLYRYYLSTEPDLAFDVLVYGRHSHRGMTFAEFRDSGDWLDAKLLEAQSVDTYYGWIREYWRGARLAGLGAECRMTLAAGEDGRILGDAGVDRQVLATLNHPAEDDPGSILFLEIEPEKQPSSQNLLFMAEAMSGGDPRRRPLILDPRELELRDGELRVTRPGLERRVRKVISRIVDADLKPYVRARQEAGEGAVVEGLQRLYDHPGVFPDLSKHLAGFYLIDKSSLIEMCLLGGVGIAPRTEVIDLPLLERYRRQPALLRGVAVKPLHGMSAMGVVVRPTLAQVEEAVARETSLAQEVLWATPLQPNLDPRIADADAQAGICCEARLVLHAGSPAVPWNPQCARLIAGLSRCHFQSADLERKIRGDAKGRGWFSNMGAILAVKAELGLAERNDVGLGMAPLYWFP